MTISKTKLLTEYKALIFDLDGTLYFQTKLRLMMALRLGGYYISHFWKLKDLFILKKFREVREQWDEIQTTTTVSLDEAQYRYIATKMNVSPEHVRAVIEEWMYEKPLSTLTECRDEALVDFINAIHEKGISVMIYSDYPVTDKLRALDIQADKTYSALDENIMSLKPDPKGLQIIMSDNQYKPSDIIMIGDRMSKDGQAAVNAGVDYIILDKSATAREKLYAELMTELD
ncbi:MAG TPA: HAD family hydrolase [Lachnospiraceae bacterium]|jgi:putative hydrolase of the HAD superfamily|nr:HAD family hydrolase [Lachnospiraceae bacterium]